MTSKYSFQQKKDYLHKLIEYCFTELSIKNYNLLTNLIYTDIHNMKTDYDIFNRIFIFYKSLHKDDFVGYSMSVDDYIMSKIKQMESIITPFYLEKQKKSVLVDIGAGDCAISSALGKYNNMDTYAIDIKQDMDWGSSSEVSHCSHVHHLFYDGTNLIETVKNKTVKPVRIIMYNHSLHHFGSFDNIKFSLSQSYKLLKKGGILFLREHNLHNDISINLQHIFLSLKYTITHHPDWKFEQTWKYMEHFIKTYTSHFFMKKNIISLCKQLGFKLINISKTPKYDISKTTLYAFIK